MDSEVFAEWFNIFIKMVKGRPLLLLFDGHMTHITLPVIENAKKEKVIIVKFPPHVTDVLQPLDVTYFGPLKRCWEQLLQERGKMPAFKRRFCESAMRNLERWHERI